MNEAGTACTDEDKFPELPAYNWRGAKFLNISFNIGCWQ
jgi:hypothetical protein